ncbi:MAG: MiaB/RimO family radical SAM methylthiotransferase, partial [Proteobacteria bacterium]|nr:MiaB/RimO family radical SAM methylthiotransferase [Pseudomonadota bacterium]
RFGDALENDIPELDGILGTRQWFEIDRLLAEVERGVRPCWHGAEPVTDPMFTRQASGPTAYVKIAEGCNMTCTFCAIPSFKGLQRSKAVDDIVAEVRQLVDGGAKEVILVSQNTTAYGLDLAREPGSMRSGSPLARLLEAICAGVPDLPWLRVHYCYPGWVNEDLLQTMARLDQVVKYLDMPLQHADPEILRAMNRPRDMRHVAEVLNRARELMPDLALRTTFIVGFPGETDAHFASILAFMDEARFDHVGIFTYFAEDGTPAATLGGQVTDKVKRRRQRAAMAHQQGISATRTARLVGRTIDVLVEGTAEGDAGIGGTGARLIGRTYRDAPEVDGFTVFDGIATRGEIVPVNVSRSGPYDLFGTQANVTLPALSSNAGTATTNISPVIAKRRIGLKSLPMLQPR